MTRESRNLKEPAGARGRGLSRAAKQRLYTLPYLAPSFLGVALFFVVPFFVVVYYSVIDGPVTKNFVFLENFRQLVRNSAFRLAVANTLKFSLIAVPLAVILPLLLAVLLTSGIRGKSAFRTVFITPMMVPVASVVLVWQVFFHYNGVTNELLKILGAEPVDWLKSDWAQVVILLLFLWKNAGYHMILFMSALSAVPRDVIEVAMLEGAGPVRRFFVVKLRYLLPSVFFVAILALINSFKIFREVYLLTGDYPYEALYFLQHYMNNMFNSLNYQRLSAAAVLMSLVMVVIIGLLLYFEDRQGRDFEE